MFKLFKSERKEDSKLISRDTSRSERIMVVFQLAIKKAQMF